MIYQFQSEQWVPASVGRVFQFFADPKNLPRMASPDEDFRIEEVQLVTPQRHPLRARINGIAGIGSEIAVSFRAGGLMRRRVRWRTRVIDFEWNRYFIEAQVGGPMEFWTHRHSFEAAPRDDADGTLIRDEIEYRPRLGLTSMLGDARAVHRSLGRRFEYHKQAVEKLFPPLPKSDLPPRIADQLRKVSEQLRRLSK